MFYDKIDLVTNMLCFIYKFFYLQDFSLLCFYIHVKYLYFENYTCDWIFVAMSPIEIDLIWYKCAYIG